MPHPTSSTKVEKSVPFLSVLKNWPTLLLLAALVVAWNINAIPPEVRAFLMPAMFLMLGTVIYLVWRSIFCRTTTDLLGDSAKLRAEAWADLKPGERMKLLIFERCVILVVYAILYAGMTITYGGPTGTAAAIEAEETAE